MQNNRVLDDLNKHLKPDAVARLLRTLRQDKAVWQALQDETYWDAVMATCKNNQQSWNPGLFALVSLSGSGVNPAIVPPTQESLGKEALKAALQTYEHTVKTGQAPVDFASQAQLALALWERRRRKGSWRGLGAELEALPGTAGAYQSWKTCLAILYGLAEDGQNLLASLLESQDWFTALRWVGHILLTMPLEALERANILAEALMPRSLDDRLQFLAWLQEQGLDPLARQLAELLTDDLNLLPEDHTLSGKNMIAGELNRAEHFRKTGNLLQIAGKLVEADYMMQEAQKCLEHVTHAVSLKTGKLGRVRGLDVIQPLAAVMGSERSDDDELPQATSIPVLLVEIDNTLRQGMQDESLDAGRRLFHLVQDSGGKAVSLADFNAVIDPGEVTGILLRLGLHQEAYETAKLFLDSRPGDGEVLASYAEACQQVGRHDEALRGLSLGASLEPENLDWRRNLASLFAKLGEAQRCYAERKAVAEAAGPLSAGDQLLLAEAALAVADARSALLACNQVLSADAENGLALALRGKSQIFLGNFKDAEADLARSTLYQPDLETAWLALAELYADMGSEQRLFETLREGVLACPESGALAYRLAETYLARGMAADALPYLRKASLLQPENPGAALNLAGTLRLIGRLDEAVEIAAQAAQTWPRDLQLARLYGEILFEIGSRKQAVAPLRQANLANPADADLAVMLANALLEAEGDLVFIEEGEIDRENLIPARECLVKALVSSPDHFGASYCLAEVERLAGKANLAIKIYRHLLELPEASQERWGWRIQTGLGRSALRAGEVDIALAALSDAAADCPNNPALQCMLAEAYLQSELPQEAVNVAEELLRQQPEDLDTILWYGKVMERTGRKDEEIQALLRGLDLNPTSPALRLSAAARQLDKGALPEAMETLRPMQAFEDAGAEEWAQAADLFLRGGDDGAARACLEKAIQASLNPRPDLLFKLAGLSEKLGDQSAARRSLANLLQDAPDHLPALLMQASLAHRAGEAEAALKILDRVQRLGGGVTNLEQLPQEYFSPELYQRISQSDSLDRLTLDCHLAVGHLTGALQVLQRLSASNPGDDHLSAALLEVRMLLLVEPLIEAPLHEPTAGALDGYARLCAARAEAALLEGDLAGAEKALAAGRASGSTPRLAAVQVRCLVKDGKPQQAAQELETLVNTLTTTAADDPLNRQDVWLGLACVEAGAWELGFDLLTRRTQQQPGDLQAQLALAQACVLAAESTQTSSELRIRAHRPPFDGANLAGTFEHAVLAIASRTAVPAVNRWRSRGQVVFHPSPQTIRALALQQPDVDDTAAVVSALRRIGNTKTAAEAALRFPNHPATLLQLSLCHLETDPARGLAFAVQAVEKEPENPIHRAAAALLAERNYQEDLALDLLESALEIWPEEADWQAWAGQLAANLKEHETAIQHLTRASQLEPQNGEVLGWLGAELTGSGAHEQAEGVLESACVLQPENGELLLSLAAVKVKLAKHADALRLAQGAGNLNPKAVRPILVQGEIAFSQGRMDAACEFAAAALALDPQDLNAVLFSARVERALGNPLAATEALDRYLQYHPGAYPAILEKARIVYESQGAYRAVQAIKAVDRNDIQDLDAFDFISRILAETGESAAAVEICQRAVGLFPNDVDMHRRLAGLLRKNGDLDQALHQLAEVVRLSPTDLDAHLALAEIYRQQRQPALALKTLQAAASVSATDPRSFLLAAELLRDGKDYSAAEAMLRKAAQLAPDDVDIRRQLGAIIALNLVHHSQEASAL